MLARSSPATMNRGPSLVGYVVDRAQRWKVCLVFAGSGAWRKGATPTSLRGREAGERPRVGEMAALEVPERRGSVVRTPAMTNAALPM